MLLPARQAALGVPPRRRQGSQAARVSRTASTFRRCPRPQNIVVGPKPSTRAYEQGLLCEVPQTRADRLRVCRNPAGNRMAGLAKRKGARDSATTS
jgi:hypothetical protein